MKEYGGYLRIPNRLSGEVNYVIIDKDNLEKYNIFVDVDFNTGLFGSAKLPFANHTTDVLQHPDTKALLNGMIENYEYLKNMILGIAKRFSTIEYMGFDIGITDSGFKCMEINSHPGIKYMQIFHSFLINDELSKYFKDKIDSIDALNVNEKAKRNGILR